VSAVVSSLSLLEKVAPRLTSEILWRVWRTPRKPRAISATVLPVMDLAQQERSRIAGHDLALYRWGSGPRVVLLVHGWEGRASDFAPIVRELQSRERTIIALDAPGHGNSSGKRTNVIDYGTVLAELAGRFERLEAVVSHSVGTPSVAAAVGNGLTADRFVSISGVATLSNLVTTFCRALRVPESMEERVRTRIEDRVFNGDRTIWSRYSAAQSPFPAESPVLIVHDRADRMVGFSEAGALAHAHGGVNRMLATEGLGHSRILAADLVLDEILAFLDGSVADSARAELA